MKRRARRARPAAAARLAQQQADFTSEGAPPPGWVADAPPVTTEAPVTAVTTAVTTPAAPQRDAKPLPPAATAKPRH